ncbi:hypothetical protein HYH03_011924 [Edaphochlamys debaryana]|uniref:Uncharacterized protein n=1 Tax=Edaphochlamys debaryana TaxID=47281 RepID=A0A835XTX0_9CHLO|nr:hypothetical protein HYH03_011924 [Edaphochlamys debaryana]|eukprot:KAG2489645.1 hypothetical protein HYH03_011924 [Edaphochlamys debaryana]
MKPENAAYALEHVKPWKGALQRLLGREQAADDRLLLVLLVTQGLGAFLMVMNHRFGGALLLLYLLPATALLYPFWEVDPERGPLAEYAVLSEFLRNVAIMGGVIGFMITTDQVPLKVKRKHLHPDLHQHRD